MSFRFIVTSAFLYRDHAKVADQIAEAFGAEILLREPCVVARFSSVTESDGHEWLTSSKISVPVVVVTEDGEFFAKAGSHVTRSSGGAGLRLV